MGGGSDQANRRRPEGRATGTSPAGTRLVAGEASPPLLPLTSPFSPSGPKKHAMDPADARFPAIFGAFRTSHSDWGKNTRYAHNGASQRVFGAARPSGVPGCLSFLAHVVPDGRIPVCAVAFHPAARGDAPLSPSTVYVMILAYPISRPILVTAASSLLAAFGVPSVASRLTSSVRPSSEWRLVGRPHIATPHSRSPSCTAIPNRQEVDGSRRRWVEATNAQAAAKVMGTILSADATDALRADAGARAPLSVGFIHAMGGRMAQCWSE